MPHNLQTILLWAGAIAFLVLFLMRRRKRRVSSR
jgi:LPXTG-motif cell wall-anchored protein